MATLDATQIPAPSILRQGTTSQPLADWDEVDGDDGQLEAVAEDFDGTMKPIDQLQPGEEAAPTSPIAPAAASEWDLGDWDVNVPVVNVSPVAAIPVESEGPGLPKEGWHPEDAHAESELPTPSLVANSDPEAAIESEVEAGAVEVETEVAASEEAATVTDEPTEATSDDILSEIIAAERRCERAQAVVDALKARSKEAKTELDSAVNHLRSLAREIANDSERPLVSRSTIEKNIKAAKEIAAGYQADPNEDKFDGDNDEDSDDEDAELDEESATEVESSQQTERGNPTRIKITKEDEGYPQLLLNDEHPVVAFGAEGENVVTIADPADENNELFLAPDEYEAVAWEELSVPAATSSTGPNSAAASQAKATQKNSRPEDNSWRKASLLDDVGLPPNLAELLESNPEKTIKTMGDLSDWTEAGRRLDEIPKIGPAKVTKIDEATDRYWAKWNERR